MRAHTCLQHTRGHACKQNAVAAQDEEGFRKQQHTRFRTHKTPEQGVTALISIDINVYTYV